jgi:hypothetical protein
MNKKILVALIALVLCGPYWTSPVEARTYRWCAQYPDDLTTLECAYDTRAQCGATVFGVGGFCKLNPRVQTRNRWH